MFYEYAVKDDRRDRAVTDARSLQVLASALALLSKESAGAYSQHLDQLVKEAREQGE